MDRIPEDFLYRDVLERGYPEHAWNDAFRLRHPSMDPGRRAKIFAPFDALAGFKEAVADKEVLYTDRIEPDGGETEELNRRLAVLAALTANGRAARENGVTVSVTYYVPCADRNNEAWGRRGRYVTAEGAVRKITPECIDIGGRRVPLKDVLRIESAYTVEDPRTGYARGIFDDPGGE